VSTEQSAGVDWSALREAYAAEFRVSPVVHPDDFLWKFIVGLAAFPLPEDAARFYFADGAQSAQKLLAIVKERLEGRYSLLEFASGYGMVTRHLPQALPDAEITSCDIHRQAMSFIRDELGVATMLSEHFPERLSFDHRFDVVFALSFFSHMPEATFGRWLRRLWDLVDDGGILVFTTHGAESVKNFVNPEVSDAGFWFMPLSEQNDLDEREYGSTISLPQYVMKELSSFTNAADVTFSGAHWWGHQDLYVVPK
jgi:2-polyprenyl-3-methyl-5-hydroxy-6-metoxy-1,4-benzoquinol methylase